MIHDTIPPQIALKIAITVMDDCRHHLIRCVPDQRGDLDAKIAELFEARQALVDLADKIDLIETEAQRSAVRQELRLLASRKRSEPVTLPRAA